MPQRHSKNNNDLAFFTYDEKRKLGYGTQKERLGKDSIKPFDACCLCLKPYIDPLCCQKGHVFCKECILECLLSQKKDIQRYLGVSPCSLLVYLIYIYFSLLLMSLCRGYVSYLYVSMQRLCFNRCLDNRIIFNFTNQFCVLIEI